MAPALPTSGLIAITSSALASAIIITYLIKRPAFTLGTRLWLFFGLGVLPIGTALAGNTAGMEATKRVEFCSSCHVMLAHTGDAFDLRSQSLAARHSRNPMFGGESCYICHADYGLFGTVFTKLNGMHHVAEYLKEYRNRSLEETLPELHLYKPMPNHNCQQCHSGKNRLWLEVDDHVAAQSDIATGEVSCASEGCHGFAHPFSKEARKRAHPEEAAP